MVITLLLFQIALEVEYWNQERDFLTNQERIPTRVDTGIIYSLYAFEFMILSSVFIARHVQGRSINRSSQAI